MASSRNSNNAAQTKATELWCSDNLHDILGYSDSALASYLTHVASTATSYQSVVDTLQQASKDNNINAVESFARELFSRAQQNITKQPTATTFNKNTKKKKPPQYSLVPLVEDIREEPQQQQSPVSKKDSKIRHRRSYEVDDTSSSSSSSRKRFKRKKSKQEDSSKRTQALSSAAPAKQEVLSEMDRDLKERDEFSKRLLLKDKEKTKHKLPVDTSSNYEERLARGEQVQMKDESIVTLDQLREQSRRAYLKKREERELTLLEKSVKEEEELFDVTKMTKAERKRMELQKQILQMTKKRQKLEDDDDDNYRLPDDQAEEGGRKEDQDKKLLMARYVEEKTEKTEQQLWEESQTQKALFPKKKKQQREEEYDYVFDEDYQVDFVMQDGIKGYDNRTKDNVGTIEAAAVTKPLTEHELLQISRQKLPVYPYREEFLAALRDHQVLILVGELSQLQENGKY